MKKIFFIFVILISSLALFSAEARSPYKTYTIHATSYEDGGKTYFYPASFIVELNQNKLTVHGTIDGSKTFTIKYLGTTTLKKWGSKVFHKFYFVYKDIYLYVSDQKIMRYPDKNSGLYYIVILDGEIEIAS